MKILALESTTEACSVALFCHQQLTEEFTIAPRQHTHIMLCLVDKLLKQAGCKLTDLDAMAFTRGPGAFTGVRISAGLVQGLAYGARLPVLAVSSLAALAQGARRMHGYRHVMACLDARKGELYWGYYQENQGLMQLVNDEHVTDPRHISEPIQKTWHVVGTGCEIYWNHREPVTKIVAEPGNEIHYPHASDVITLAIAQYKNKQWVEPHQALPVYLRDNVTY